MSYSCKELLTSDRSHRRTDVGPSLGEAMPLRGASAVLLVAVRVLALTLLVLALFWAGALRWGR